MNARDAQEVACELLYREAELLDERRWDEWLQTYASDCVFWVPSWTSDLSVCTDPQRELSLIYLSSRAGLEERVSRIRSGRSVASLPPPRTMHALSNVRVRDFDDSRVTTRSTWAVDVFSVKDRTSLRFFGWAEHTLKHAAGAWTIASKKAIILNDYLPSSLDIYCV